MAASSHFVVLGLGLVFVLPVLTGSYRGTAGRAQAPTVGADYGAVGVVRGQNALAQVDSAMQLSWNSPATAPSPTASATPRAASRSAAPAPRAIAVPPAGTGGSGVAAIYAAFRGSPGLTWALRVGKCESGYNPRSVNRSSGASGLFQFMPSTWNAHFAGWNIWDPNAQARAALYFYNHGWTSAWTCK